MSGLYFQGPVITLMSCLSLHVNQIALSEALLTIWPNSQPCGQIALQIGGSPSPAPSYHLPSYCIHSKPFCPQTHGLSCRATYLLDGSTYLRTIQPKVVLNRTPEMLLAGHSIALFLLGSYFLCVAFFSQIALWPLLLIFRTDSRCYNLLFQKILSQLPFPRLSSLILPLSPTPSDHPKH